MKLKQLNKCEEEKRGEESKPQEAAYSFPPLVVSSPVHPPPRERERERRRPPLLFHPSQKIPFPLILPHHLGLRPLADRLPRTPSQPRSSRSSFKLAVFWIGYFPKLCDRGL